MSLLAIGAERSFLQYIEIDITRMTDFFASFQYLSFSDGGWGWNMLRGLANTLQIAIGAYALG